MTAVLDQAVRLLGFAVTVHFLGGEWRQLVDRHCHMAMFDSAQRGEVVGAALYMLLHVGGALSVVVIAGALWFALL